MKTFLKKFLGWSFISVGNGFVINGGLVLGVAVWMVVSGDWTGQATPGDIFFETVGIVAVGVKITKFGGKVIKEAWDEEWEATKDDLAL